MRYHRFELAFEGEPQDVGFLNGLSDIGFTSQKEFRLQKPFTENLPSPDIAPERKEPLLFFFTKKGLNFFLYDIYCIAKEAEAAGWQFLYRGFSSEPEDIRYKDEYQIAVWKSQVPKEGMVASEITAAELADFFCA